MQRNSSGFESPPSPYPSPPRGGRGKGEGGWKFKRFAHRGASGEAPENTIPAIRLAIEKYRVDGVEIDVCLAKDGIPMVIHDATLKRTTDGMGRVRDFTAAELKERDSGFRFDPEGKGTFPYRGRGIRIPTLEKVLTEFPDTHFFLEIKETGPEGVEKILACIQRIQRKGSLLIGSFHGKVIRELRRLSPSGVENTFSQREVIRAYLAFRLGFKKLTPPAPFVSIPRTKWGIPLDDPQWISFLHEQGVSVYYWTVNETKEMEELLKRGADGILTDYPDRLNRVVGRQL